MIHLNDITKRGSAPFLWLVAPVNHRNAIGNRWAAAGMLRVVQIMNNSIYASELAEQSADLTSWINEILDGIWIYQVCKIAFLG